MILAHKLKSAEELKTMTKEEKRMNILQMLSSMATDLEFLKSMSDNKLFMLLQLLTGILYFMFVDTLVNTSFYTFLL